MTKKLQKNVFILTLPIFIEMAFFILMGSVDTLMISFYENNYNAVGSVAAVGNASTVINLFGVLINVVSAGISVVVSQYLGAKKEAQAKQGILTGIIMQVFIGMMITIILLTCGNLLFQLIDTPLEIQSLSYDYLFYTAISLLFVAITNAISAGLRSYGHTNEVMVVVIIANIFNVIFNYIFIFGHFGSPVMGVSGAALSTLLMRFLSMLVTFYLLKHLIDINVFKVSYDKESMKKILKIGVPSALENMTYNIMQFVILSFVNKLGTEMITARTYVNTFLSYIYLFSGSFASANAIITGYYIGEEDYEGAYRNTLKTTFYTVMIIVVVVGLVNLSLPFIASLVTQNETIIHVMQQIFLFAILLEVGRAFNLIIIQSLRGAGDTTFPLIMAVISMLGIGITAAYFFSIAFGLLGVYLGIICDELFRGLTMLVRWLSKTWMHKSLVKE